VAKANNPRQSLRIHQVGGRISIAVSYNASSFLPESVVLVDRATKEDIAIVPITGDDGDFKAVIDLADYDIDSETVVDAFFEGRQRVRVGRFVDTPAPTSDAPAEIRPYFTKAGNLSFSSESSRRPSVRLATTSLTFVDGILEFSGDLETDGARVTRASVVFRSREGMPEARFVASLTPTKDPSDVFGRHMYRVDVRVPLVDVAAQMGFLTDDALDPVVEIETDWDTETVPFVRIEAPMYRQRRKIKPFSVPVGDSVVVFLPYFTYKANRLAVRVERHDREVYDYLKKLLPIAPLLRAVGMVRGTWMIGEMPYRARDNGAKFFRYVRTEHPRRRAFFVVDPDSPDAELIADLGNVVGYRTKEHARVSLEAKRLVGTHHFENILPSWHRAVTDRARGIRVFLQHGVMGTKNMVDLYGVGTGLMADHFVVSSVFEKEMIVNDFGYRPGQVAVTGLPRFDSLLDGSQQVERRILVVPTWRDWLFSEADILESEYFEQWRRFLTDERLRHGLSEAGVSMTFMLHPNLRRHSHLFAIEGVEVRTLGDVDLQVLLKRSSMLITDYSSVGFDFSFLHRPVAYFMFDVKRFLRRPSHLDVFADLPGSVSLTADDLVDTTLETVRSDFAMPEEFVERADRFIDHRDQQSSERVYGLVRSARRKVHVWNRFARSDLGKTVWSIARKHKQYHPFMRRWVFGLARALPGKQGILFESATGRQYTGNPKYLYQRLAERGIASRSFWVTTSTARMKEPTTRKIARYSPAYYWYLGRSKVWVNDQNFNEKLVPGRGTQYIQTWHGSPIKKMLHDLDTVYGRTKGYKDRVSASVASWSVLISQSPTATKHLRSAFRYEGRVLESGYPRTDAFFRPDVDDRIAQVRDAVGVPRDKKVILYAPTFRDDVKSSGRWELDFRLDLELFRAALGDDYHLLVRGHMLTGGDRKVTAALDGFGGDVSKYHDVQELLLIADVLITDYSSVAFDYAVTRRPIVFFAYDLERYRDKLRGFYLDFERDMPGPIVKDTQGVVDAITSIDEWHDPHGDRLNAFIEAHCPLDDGQASDRVIDALFADEITAGPS